MQSEIDIPALAQTALAEVPIPADRREAEEASLAKAMRAYVASGLGEDLHAALACMGRVTATTVAMLYAPAVEVP